MAREIQTTLSNEGVLTIKNSAGSLEINLHALSDEIKFKLLAHGAKQKVADAAAIPRDEETGLSATPSQKFEAMRAVALRLIDGSWGIERTGAASALHVPTLIDALVEFTGQDVETIAVKVNGMKPAERTALRDNPKIAGIYARLRSAQNPTINSDELLDALM